MKRPMRRTESHPFVVGDKVRISAEVPREGGKGVYVDGYLRIGDDWTVKLIDRNGMRSLRYPIRYLSLIEPAGV